MYGAGAEYALHSMLILAKQSAPVSISDLASYQGIPERFLAKIFTRLKGAKLVKGTEGISGGFVLAKPAENIHVSQLLKAVDPGRSLFACAEIRQNCTLFADSPPRWAVAGPCRIHAFMEEAERKLHEFLASKTLSDLVCEYSCKAPKVFAGETEVWFQGRRLGRTARS
ncbi:MAG TPA: Rrf2 family transcriptional regulator [Polyangia bacterium]